MIMVCTALASHKHNHRQTHHKVVESTKEQKSTNPASSATIEMCKRKGRFSQGCFLSKAIICLSVIRQNRPYTRNQHFLNTHSKTLSTPQNCFSKKTGDPNFSEWLVGLHQVFPGWRSSCPSPPSYYHHLHIHTLNSLTGQQHTHKSHIKIHTHTH